MSNPEEQPTPALFEHANRVYEEMLKRSHKENDEVLGTVDIYEGHLTRLFSELGIANPYYTKIKHALEGQGCIVQIRRGGGAALSKWQLCFPPDEETFRTVAERKRNSSGRLGVVEQRVKDLTRMVNELTDRIEMLEKVR